MAPKKVEVPEDNEEQKDDDAAEKSRAWPKADNKMDKELHDIIQRARTLQLVKKGANETTKALNRGKADLVILAADTEPLEIILHLPLLCEDKNVPYVYVRNQSQLGKSCGVSRNIIAVAIVENDGPLAADVKRLKDRVEGLLL